MEATPEFVAADEIEESDISDLEVIFFFLTSSSNRRECALENRLSMARTKKKSTQHRLLENLLFTVMCDSYSDRIFLDIFAL